MTSCTKPIWVVTFKYNQKTQSVRKQRVAAYDLVEVMSFFNKEGLSHIDKIENTGEEVTYHY